MGLAEWLVVGGAAVLTGIVAWFFFGPKRSIRAAAADGVQEVTVTVKGGYSPDLIEVVAGVLVRLAFDRQESGDCSSRVVLPDFRINQLLPANETTTVEFVPDEPGEYPFGCGMNMLRGRIHVVGGTATGGGGSAVALADRPGVTVEPTLSAGNDSPIHVRDVVAAEHDHCVGARPPAPSEPAQALSTDSKDSEERERAAEIRDLRGVG